MFDLTGKVAIVTGGGSGIGWAASQRLAAAGATVVIADINDCNQLAEQQQYHYVMIDVSDEASVSALFGSVQQRFGGIDILVNNAAISSGHPLVEADAKRSEKFWQINLMGVQFGLKQAASKLRKGGAIVNLSSITAIRGFPQWAEYGATKGAIISLTQTAAIELAVSGIRVNCICPGIIDTPMAMREAPEMVSKNASIFAPLGRIGEPDEIAAAIHFLVSDDASYITGQVLAVDGGWSAGTSLQAFGMVAGQ